MFDAFLVTMQVIDQMLDLLVQVSISNISAMRVLRILRVVRIVRVIRLLRMISELRSIVASVIGSLKAVGWTMLILLTLIYLVAVYLTQLLIEARISSLSDAAELAEFSRWYGTLPRSLLTLYQAISGGVDWNDAATPLIDNVSPIFGLLFAMYVAFTVLAILNVVTGVFVEAALQSAKEDKEIYLVNHIRGVIDGMGAGNNETIDWPTFKASLNTTDMREVFKAIDVDIEDAAGLFKLLDLNGNGVVTKEEILDGCLGFRGPAKALDLALMMRDIKRMNVIQEAHYHEIMDARSRPASGDGSLRRAALETSPATGDGSLRRAALETSPVSTEVVNSPELATLHSKRHLSTIRSEDCEDCEDSSSSMLGVVG